MKVELEFKTKLPRAEFLKMLKEKFDVGYNDKVLDNPRVWEDTENYAYLTYFPEYLSYPATPLDVYYLRHYWITVGSKRFERRFDEDLLHWEVKVMEDYEVQDPLPDVALMEQLDNEAVARVEREEA
jgi:hypothetical protein